MTSASAGVSFTVLIGYWESLIAGAAASSIKGAGILTASRLIRCRLSIRRGLDEAGVEHEVSSEHQEVVQVVEPAPEPVKPRRKGIYLLPNLMTTACLFSGFYGIVAAIDKHFDTAGKAVFVAMIFDTLDGRLARLTKTESAFGKEYDSLADMVSFGLAPAIIAYQFGVVRIAEFGRFWGRFGWLACFFYAAAAALRLARFNARAATADKRYFEGLPSPSAAAIVAAFIWFASAWPEPGLLGLIGAFVVTASAGAVMVSSFSYP